MCNIASNVFEMIYDLYWTNKSPQINSNSNSNLSNINILSIPPQYASLFFLRKSVRLVARSWCDPFSLDLPHCTAHDTYPTYHIKSKISLPLPSLSIPFHPTLPYPTFSHPSRKPVAYKFASYTNACCPSRPRHYTAR